MTRIASASSSSSPAKIKPVATAAPVRAAAAAGLEGIVAASSGLCMIDGQAGRLVYRGYEIGDLVEHTSFEEVAHLLWEGKLPNKTELATLINRFAAAMPIPRHDMAILEALPAWDCADGCAAHGRQLAVRDRPG